MEEEEFIQGNADDIDVVWFGLVWFTLTLNRKLLLLDLPALVLNQV